MKNNVRYGYPQRLTEPSNILVTLVSLVVLGFGLSFLLEASALLVLAPVASTTAVFINITSDAASKWNKNVIVMPVSRKQIIVEKFLFYIRLAFEPEKSQVVFMMSFMASTGFITGLVFFINVIFPVKEHILIAFSIVLFISVIWFFISYLIAVMIYQKRDIV